MASRPIEVRPAAAADLPAVNAIYNHYVRASHATFDLEERTLDACRAWFEAHRSPVHPVLVAERDGRVIGFASAGMHRARAAYASSVETSAYVDAAAIGGGVGRSLYAALFEILDGRELHRAVAGIALPNPASVALHLVFGFRPVGRFTEVGRKFGRYWDVEWYERSLGHG
jgi:phosphinothricin acetyltransferase